MPVAAALVDAAGRVGLDLAVLAIFPLVMRFRSEVDLVLVAVIAEEQHLTAVGDQDQRIVGKGHGAIPPVTGPERRTRTGAERCGDLSPLSSSPAFAGEGD